MTEQHVDLAKAAVWDVAFRAGERHERSLWHWSAGSISRAMNGLRTRPVRPLNPYLPYPPREKP